MLVFRALSSVLRLLRLLCLLLGLTVFPVLLLLLLGNGLPLFQQLLRSCKESHSRLAPVSTALRGMGGSWARRMTSST